MDKGEKKTHLIFLFVPRLHCDSYDPASGVLLARAGD